MSRFPARFARQLCAPVADKARTRKPRLTVQSLEDRSVPATINVTSFADTGGGTLRAAITAANASAGVDDTIVFDATVFNTARTISLATALPVFSAAGGALTITGPGEALLNVERASGAGTDFRVFGSQAPTLNMSGMTVSGGTNVGAGLFAFGVATLDHMVFQSATTSLGPAGGIIVGDSASATITNSKITNNTVSAASPNGGAGGILVGTGSSLRLIDSEVTNNTVTDGNGGGIFLNPNAALIVQGSIISGNKTTSAAGNSFGGGISANSGCNISIYDSTISDNTVTGAAGKLGFGGGIFHNGTPGAPGSTATGSIAIVGSTIANNKANGGSGGGIYANDGVDISVTDSKVTGNSAGIAGGGIFEYSSTDYPGLLSITRTTISGNTAGIGGGVFGYYLASLTVESSTISGNTASLASTSFIYGGGGMYLWGTGPATIRNSTIANNISQRGGGGIEAINQFYPMVLENCTVTGNSAAATGTISGFTYGGGGINMFAGSGPVTLTNSVVAANTNPGGQPDIASTTAPITLQNSVVGDITGFTAVGTSVVAPGTPLGLGTLGDYGGPTQTIPLLPTSPLRDAGDNSLLGGIITDQRGFDRPSALNPLSDIGAYEIQPVTVTIDQSVTTSDPSNSASTITYDVHFNVPVTGFDDNADLDFTGSDPALGTLSGTVAPVGTSQTDYTVTVTGMTAGSEGDIVLSIGAGVATDIALFPNAASTTTDNVVHFDDVAPTVTINKTVGQADPTNVGPISFDVSFSEPVLGFGTGSIDLTGSTGVGTPTVLSVTPTGPKTYTVLVTGMNGSGNVVAKINTNAVTDPAGNGNTVSTSTDNSVAFDNVKPTVTINKGATQPDPTQVGTVVFDVLFSEPVTGFTSADVDLSTSTAGPLGSFVVNVTGTGPAYTVTVSGITDRGDVIATILAGAVQDLVGNDNVASTSTDNSVAYLHAGTISFTTSTQATTEGSIVTVTATRTGGTDGDVTVQYATNAGTAHVLPIALADYQADTGFTLAGTLSWADGVGGDQIFKIKIVDDAANEGKESFTVDLSTPTGGVILGATTTQTISIAPSDGLIINGAAVKPAKPSATFIDGDGDIATVALSGKQGSATVYITDPDGDGHGPIEWIVLSGTSATASKLTITDKKAKGGIGDGHVTIGDITGAGLKSITAKGSDLIGTVGVNLTSYLGSLTVANITNGGDIITTGAPPAKPANLGTTITAGVISDGTDIAITGAPLTKLTAISVGVGNISAPSVGTISVTGKAATKAVAAIPGDFKSNLTIAGTGLGAVKNPVALKSLTAKGAVSNVLINVGSGAGTIGNVGKVTVGSFDNSRLFAGYAGADDGSSMTPTGTIAGFNTGKVGPFKKSYVIADNIKSVSLTTVDTANAGTKFGFVFHTSFGSLTAKTLGAGTKVTYNKKTGGTQVLNGDLQVLKV
jgi:Right handed beta helix region/Calx-beta domain